MEKRIVPKFYSKAPMISRGADVPAYGYSLGYTIGRSSQTGTE